MDIENSSDFTSPIEVNSLTVSLHNCQLNNTTKCQVCYQELDITNGGNCCKCGNYYCRRSSCSFYSTKLDRLFCYKCWLKDPDYWSWFDQTIRNDLISLLQSKFDKPYLRPPTETIKWSDSDIYQFFESNGIYRPN